MPRHYVLRQCYFLYFPRTIAKRKDTIMSIIPTNRLNENSIYMSEKFARIVDWVSARLMRWVRSYIAYRERQTALAVLRRFSDYELKDIGLYRSELPDAVAGRLPDPATKPLQQPVAPDNTRRLAA